MSYPEPRYLGDTGEVTATVRAHGQPPHLNLASGGSVEYLATSATTGGEFGLYRWTLGVARTGAGEHFHRTFSESFFILSGTVSLYNGDTWVDGTAGDFLYVPQGGIHAFKNDSDAIASMLVLFTPGAPREEYFESLVAMSRGELVLTDEERAEFYRRHDNNYV
jgi:quercetin dioxygenase-like cupin family protein